MNKVAMVVAIIALVLSGTSVYMFTKSPSSDHPAGAVAGGDFYFPVNFYSGVTNSNIIATTSQGTSITVSAAEFKNWANGNMVSFAQGLPAATTITFPASSTLSAIVPKAGDRQTFCIRNATSTATLSTILAGSTGVNLLVASSSTTILGSKTLLTGKVGCITLVRQAATATTFDIDALLTVYN